MLSSVALLVAALSSGHKIGLAAVGISFIVFALISSFVLPRSNPNFPGRSVGWYVTLCVLFFVAMMAAVLIFGREKEEAKAGEQPTATATTAPTTTGGGGGGGGGGGVKGDPQAGKQVFASNTCGSCHTLKAAGSKGTVGPNLDQLKPQLAAIVRQVENGGGPMPAFKDKLSAKQIQDVAAFVYTSTHSR
jgi:mono/diheme cytochrome c family protein